MIYVNEKDLVVPGEVLAEGDYYSGRGTFEEDGKVCSKLLGLVSLRNKKVSVIPLKSKYLPKKGDVVIGKIQDVRFSMWEVDLNSPYSGILPASEVFGRDKKELSRVFDVGDVLFLRIVDVDEVKKVKLGLKGRGMGKFKGGIVVDIAPTKVPRLIGKKGSMINMIKNKTGCKIVVGQNGLVWVKGSDDMEQLVREIINLIEREAHTSGLTDRVKNKLYLDIDGELPEDKEAKLAEEAKAAEQAVDEGLKAPEIQDFRDEVEEELAAEQALEDEEFESDSDDFEDDVADESVDCSDDFEDEVADESVENSDDFEDEVADESVDCSDDFEDDVADDEIVEELIDDEIGEESVEDDSAVEISDSEDLDGEVSDEQSSDDEESEENLEESIETKESEDKKESNKKFVKKHKFLDTFESIKKQEKRNKSSFVGISSPNSSSPTLNIGNAGKKAPKWRKRL